MKKILFGPDMCDNKKMCRNPSLDKLLDLKQGNWYRHQVMIGTYSLSLGEKVGNELFQV